MVAVQLVLSVLEVVLKAILELDDLGRIGGSWISDGFCLGRLVHDECMMIDILTVMLFPKGHHLICMSLFIIWKLIIVLSLLIGECRQELSCSYMEGLSCRSSPPRTPGVFSVQFRIGLSNEQTRSVLYRCESAGGNAIKTHG